MKNLLPLLIACSLSLNLIAQVESSTELAQRLEKHVSFLASDSLEGRGLGTEGTILAQHYIATAFQAMGLQSYHQEDYFQHFDLRIGLAMVPGTNVVGYLEGSDTLLKDEYMVIGAHYDHLGYAKKKDSTVIYHGADDNASGVATLIELARYFSRNRDLMKRSILFIAFDAEESGLLGARKFINENDRFDIQTVRTMFSIDMVGMYTSNKGLSLGGIGSLEDGKDLARSIALLQDFRLKSATDDISFGTDTYPFGEKGIPAVHAFTGTKSPYHKPEDTYEKLDYEGMAKITVYLQSLISEVSGRSEIIPATWLTSVKKPHAVQFNVGATAGLGSSFHKYPDEFYSAKDIVAYNAGIFLQVHLGRRFTCQPEVLYQSDGSRSPEGTFRRQSINVPVNLHLNLVNQNNGMNKVYLFAGGYYLYTFSGNNGSQELDFSVYRDQEWGLRMGLGVDIMKVQLKYTWQRSLTNLSQTDGSKLFPTGWYISLGYIFNR